MLIDSGADASMVPESVVSQLELDAGGCQEFEIEGIHASPTRVRAVFAELAFFRYTFRGDFLVTTRPWGILGRNILNRVRVLLDGPAHKWDEWRS